MTIISWNFLFFCLVGVIIYWLLPSRSRLTWLLFLSLLFSLSWGWFPTLLLLVLSLTTFFLAQRTRPERGKIPLFIGILLSLAVLIVFKSQEFFILPLAQLTSLNEQTLNLLAPIGASFYTLQAISYLLDVSRGQLEAYKNPGAFILYLAYFPKLLSGPIERARIFVPQLYAPKAFDPDLLRNALGFISLGLLRKVVFADALFSMIPKDMFWIQQKGMLTWLIAFAFALYNDFCGYTNMMQGMSLLFGIELSPNFRQPFFARNFSEFWNRWHITLSHWLRDYIYFPVRRFLAKRFSSSATLVHISIPPMITMLVSGLWHSRLETGVTHMLLWGGLHGAYQIAERLSFLWGQNKPVRERSSASQVLASLTVFALVSLAWIPFQVGNSASITSWMAILNPDLWWVNMPQVAWIAAASLGIDALQHYEATDLFFQKWSPWQRAFATALLILLIFISIRGSRPVFVYAGF